jgi:hypothetical protein
MASIKSKNTQSGILVHVVSEIPSMLLLIWSGLKTGHVVSSLNIDGISENHGIEAQRKHHFVQLSALSQLDSNFTWCLIYSIWSTMNSEEVVSFLHLHRLGRFRPNYCSN